MKTKIYSVFLSLFLFSGFLQAQTINGISSPASGATWAAGTTNTITWAQSGTVTTVITLNGPSTHTITAAYYGVDGTNNRTWEIPNYLPIGTYTMTIANKDIPTNYVTSSFNISQGPPYINVLTPDGSEPWKRGTSHNITWEDNLTSAVRIDLYTAAESAIVQSISGWAEGTSFTWTIPSNIVPGFYKIRFANTSNPPLVKFSNTFEISTATGTITLNTPAAGSDWARNSVMHIWWTTGINEDVKVQLFNPNTPWAGGGTGYTDIAYSTSENTLDWWIPSYITPSAGYKIRVSSFLSPTSCFAESTFTVTTRAAGAIVTVTQPNIAGVTWPRNTAYTIEWNKNFDEDVRIEIKKVGTSTWYPLTWSTGGFSWSWWIPYYQAPGEYNIKISSTIDPSGVFSAQSSTNTLTITASAAGGTGTVTLLTPPVTPTSYPRSSKLEITWTKTFTENVKVELYNPFGTGTKWELLDWSNGGTKLDWWIPSYMTPATNYKIRVSNVSTGAASATHTFTILASAPGGKVTMTSPDPDLPVQTWVRNTANTISWKKNFDEDVRIELIKAGTNTGTLTWSTGGYPVDGVYSWSWWIPFYQEAGDYQLRVSSTLAPATVYTQVAFTIALSAPGAAVTITSPPENVTLAWARNTTQTISWKKNFSQDVRIELIKAGTNTETITWSTGGYPVDGVYSFIWWIPNYHATGEYNIKVSNTVSGGISDTHTITIVPFYAGAGIVTITSPDEFHAGDVTWHQNENKTIEWKKNFGEDVSIVLKKSGGATTTLTQATVGYSFNWWIPYWQVTGAYSITVSSTLSGASDTHTFTIDPPEAAAGTVTITSPAPGETWYQNETKIIEWKKNFGEDVKIELIYGGATTTITTATEGLSFSWWIENWRTAGDYQLRVSSTLAPATVYTQVAFIIAAGSATGGTVSITNPDPTHTGNADWYRNSTEKIKWGLSSGEDVKIELKKITAPSYQTLAYSTGSTGGEGEWEWVIPFYQELATYNIRVTSWLTGFSDTHTVTIKAVSATGTCTVTSPNGGEWWGVGTTHPITWTKSPTFIDNVRIELKRLEGGGDWETLQWSVGGESWSWWIENWRPAGTYKIRISNVNSSAGPYFESPAFHIEIYNLMTYPNPVISTLTLKADVFTQSNTTIEVYNHFGAKLLTRKVELQSSDEYSLSLDGFVNDVYYVVVTGNGRRISKSIIVQH